MKTFNTYNAMYLYCKIVDVGRDKNFLLIENSSLMFYHIIFIDTQIKLWLTSNNIIIKINSCFTTFNLLSIIIFLFF